MRVVVEATPKRAFASALDWPGWARSGRGEEEALEALVAYGPRYAAVAKRARIAFKPPATSRGLTVVERLAGGGTTDFGAPGEAAAAEDERISAADAKRLTALLKAAWATFDAVSARSFGVELAKGPRGGGRNLDKMVEHVRGAEVAYLNKLGSRSPASTDEDPDRPMAHLRVTFAEAFAAIVADEPVPDPSKVKKRWAARYAIRRTAWHTLDHAWEIEDRSA